MDQIFNQFLLAFGKIIDGIINYYNSHQSVMIPLIAGFILGRVLGSFLSLVIGAVVAYVALAHIPALTHAPIPNITPKIEMNVSQ
jgi:mannose/fructose/N-acetylgalactosamine-specific phosphotransferase system component IIC